MAETSRASDGFTLAAVGDTEITRPVLEREGRSARFDDVLDRLRSASASVANLELVAAAAGSYAAPPRPVKDHYQYLPSSPGMVLWSDPDNLDELAGMGIDLFAAASNHSFDLGRQGMLETMANLEARNLTYAGLGRNLAEARSPSYLSTPDGRVGLVSACTSIAPGSEAGKAGSFFSGRPGINPLHVYWTYRVPERRMDQLREIAQLVGIDDAKPYWLSREHWDQHGEGVLEFMHMAFEPAEDESTIGIDLAPYRPDEDAVLEQVQEAAAQADYVVMTLHSHQGRDGKRNVGETPDFLVEFAHECIDRGADAVVCTGPHVLRGIEVYDGKPVFYSLGNFIRHIETQDRLPVEVFEYHGIDDDTRPSKVVGGAMADSDSVNPDYWRTVLPTCRYDDDGTVETIELVPCSLGLEQSVSRRGTPERATGDAAIDILDHLRELSAPYGTEIRIDGERGTISPS